MSRPNTSQLGESIGCIYIFHPLYYYNYEAHSCCRSRPTKEGLAMENAWRKDRLKMVVRHEGEERVAFCCGEREEAIEPSK